MTAGSLMPPNAGHGREVGTELAPVADRQPEHVVRRTSRGHGRRGLALETGHQGVVRGPQRIEINGHGPIGRHDVANAGDRIGVQAFGQRNGARVDLGIDPFLEFDDERRVAGGNDPECAHEATLSARSSLP